MSVPVTFDTVEDDEVWSDVQPAASKRLLAAALDCFSRQGYHGTTTRQIAIGAGMSPGAVYVHYRSKGELLYKISYVGHQSALAALEGAVASDAVDPMERMVAIVRAFAGWHARHHRLAKVVQYELNALPPQRRREIVRLRKRFSTLVENELSSGIAKGAFGEIDVEGMALAILSLCIDIARWYRAEPDRDPEQLAELYADIIRRALRPGSEPST